MSDLEQAIRAAAGALWRTRGISSAALCNEVARGAVEAAWQVLTQPLADLQRDLDYATQPDAWGHESAAELDRLAAFEIAIRDALKPWTWNGIDADGKSYKDVVNEVGAAVIALEQAREALGQVERDREHP